MFTFDMSKQITKALTFPRTKKHSVQLGTPSLVDSTKESDCT